ncbi:MAG: hypothetical protein ACTSO5_15405 [Candidatus Heimdallarchaeaceae archaeon]
MTKFLGKIGYSILLIHFIVISSTVLVSGYQPVITSRISEVSEIAVIADPYNDPNATLFGITVTVEILNRAEENQTVIELSDFFPKVFINATLTNQSLEFEFLAYAHATIMIYYYQPGITVEHSYVRFYINQTGLSKLPDGNYTLWRPINTAYIINNITTTKLPTIITMNSGVMNINYTNFTNYTPTQTNTDKVSLSFTIPIITLLISVITISLRKCGCRRFKSCLPHQF